MARGASVRSLYALPPSAVKSTVLRMASRRLTCPLMLLDQVGALESKILVCSRNRLVIKYPQNQPCRYKHPSLKR